MQHEEKEKIEILLKAISIALKKLRQERKLSLNLFAIENGIQKSLVSRLENAKNEPAFLSIWKVAEAFDIKPSELVSKIEKELPKDFCILDL